MVWQGRTGNRHMRRVLNQAANSAVKVKGSIFEIVYRRSVPRLGHNQAIGAIAHRQVSAESFEPTILDPVLEGYSHLQ